VAELPTPVQLNVDALGVERRVQLGQPLAQIRDVGDHVRAHVRRGHHGVGAVSHCSGHEVHALGQLRRPIVEPM